MIRWFALALGAMLVAVACSSVGGSHMVPAPLPPADQAATRGLAPSPSFKTSGRVTLRKSGWVKFPAPAGFAGAINANGKGTVAPGTVAYVVSTSANPVPLSLPAADKALLYATFSLSKVAQFGSGTQLRFSPPNPRRRYYVALYDPTNPNAGWLLAYTRASSIGGTTVTLSAQVPLALAPGQPYTFALYATAQSVAPPPSPARAELVGSCSKRTRLPSRHRRRRRIRRRRSRQ